MTTRSQSREEQLSRRNKSGIKRWLILALVSALLLQGCTSVSYSIPVNTVGVGGGILAERTFEVGFQDNGISSDSRTGMAEGVLDGLKAGGLRPAGSTGSDYRLVVTITGGAMQKGGASSFTRFSTAVLAGVTLLIFPYVIPYEYAATIEVHDARKQDKVAQLSVPMTASVCNAITPLAYLCVPNAGTAGRSLGQEIANRISRIIVKPP